MQGVGHTRFHLNVIQGGIIHCNVAQKGRYLFGDDWS